MPNLLRDLGCAAAKYHRRNVRGSLRYNFCPVHKTLRVIPAMEAGIADHVWSLEELTALLDLKVSERAG